MKRKYYLLLLIGVLSVSCVKQLDITPENSITFRGIKAEKDIESLMYAIDMIIRKNTTHITNNFSQLHGVYYNKHSERWTKDYGIKTWQRGIPNTPWNGYYNIIHRANIPLRYLDQTDLTEDRKNYYRGRAYFYQAFAYMRLISIFGDVILIKDDVILDPVTKTPWPEVADYAIELAEKAVVFLPEYNEVKDAQGNAPINKFVPSKGAANAVLANLAAWKAGAKYLARPDDASYDEHTLWIKAEKACTDIIVSGQYVLATNPEEICESVLVGNSRESIFEVDIRNYWDEIALEDPTYRGLIGMGADQPQNGADPNFQKYVDNPSYGNFSLFADSVRRLFSSDDLRLQSWFYKFDSLANVASLKGRVFSNKYRKFKHVTSGPLIGQPIGVFQNLVLWRLAGIYLLRAECRARLGKNAEAIADLNIVRARSQATPYQSGEGDLRYVIYEEKVKKEFLFEMNSFWFDAVRNGYVGIEPTLKEFGYDSLSGQDLIDGALFEGLDHLGFANNPLLRQNIYWNGRLGQ